MSPSPQDTYRIVLSPRAGAALEEIFRYIAQHSPQNAPSWSSESLPQSTG